jgi:hypothetical protein
MGFEIRPAIPGDAAGWTHACVSLAAVPEPPPVPDGLRLVDYGSLDPRQVWRASAAVAEGDPSGLSSVTPYDEWLVTEWNHPDLRRNLSIALLEGNSVVSFVTTTADPAEVRSADQGPRRRADRCLHRERRRHVPMLAVNHWLGYQPTASSWTATKTL